ncbi:MAG: hypothetical protein ACM3QS_18880, partial [Bacteroidota bacterium]
MEAPRLEPLPPPPGVIGSLKAGFDTISTHLTAVLLPLALDLLLWLGPRLSIKEYTQNLLPRLVSGWQELGFSAAQIQRAVEGYRAEIVHLDSLNLLSLLRTFPIGITSLMSGAAPALTPLGEPPIMQVGPLDNIFFLFLGVTLLGWLGGALYFRWVASLVLPEGLHLEPRAVLNSLTLSSIAFIAMIVIGLPLFLIIYVLNAISPLIGQGTLLFLGFLSMWLVVPLFFAGHGIFIRSQNVFTSILSGVQMARFSLPNSSLFVLSVLFISIGLNYVWIIPKPDSWMLLIGIFGHAFITTALLAASF